MTPEKAGMITYVVVPQSDGTTVSCNTKLAVEQANGEDIETRFARAGSALICQGALFELLGYEIGTDTAIAILEGRFEVLPPRTDGPTLLLLEEMANIWQMMKDGKVDIVVTVDDFKHYWRRAKERTS